MRTRDVPVWLTDGHLLADLERRGKEALAGVFGRRPSMVDRHAQQRAGWHAVDPSEAGVYFVDATGIPLAPSGADELDHDVPSLRGLLPGDAARVLRSILDQLDRPVPSGHPRVGRPPAPEDRVAIRGWYRHRLRVNQELRAAVLAETSRPSKQVLDVLGRQRIVFRDAGIRVTILDRHWPEREALTYCAARLALSPARTRALIKPIKRR